MSMLGHVLSFFGVHMRPRNIVLPTEFSQHTDAAEVYDERQQMSASAYIAHLKQAMAGTADAGEKRAWMKYIRKLEPDAYRAFFFDVDNLIEQGELVHVLSPEEVEQVQQRVLDNIEHWRGEASAIAKDYGIDPAVMHRFLNGENTITGTPQIITDEDLLAMPDDEAEVWAEDEDDNE